MSTRPRTSGNYVSAGQQQSSAVQNFKPKSEWKHEEVASFLLVYLPGFILDQLTITPDYSNGTVRVEGKRRLPNNRLMPVDETFNVPHHLDLSKMDKQFGRGILMLKIPRNLNVVPHQSQQQQSVEDTPELERETMANDPPKPKQSTDKASIDEKNEEKLVDNGREVKPERIDEAAIEEKGSMRAQTNVVGTKLDRPIEQEANSLTSSATNPILTTLTKTEEEKLVDKAKQEGPEIDSVVKNNGDGVKKNRSKEESKGSAMDSETKVAKVEDKVKGNKEMGKEDKTLIVNMGIAVVIIMGLGVSLLYTLGH